VPRSKSQAKRLEVQRGRVEQELRAYFGEVDGVIDCSHDEQKIYLDGRRAGAAHERKMGKDARQISWVQRLIEETTAKERERAAGIVENAEGCTHDGKFARLQIAAAIRSGDKE
jgi:glycine/D-amino acid oxidase-like deaminating enzyme